MLEDITLYEFNSLEELEKIEALGEYGQIVAHKFEGKFKFMLYQINNFYVEIKYIEKTNAFVELRSFKTTNLLDSYISDIDVNGL
ncbi:MAG: hypothetical protein ABIW34_13445 [Ginsengibacter sp.]